MNKIFNNILDSNNFVLLKLNNKNKKTSTFYQNVTVSKLFLSPNIVNYNT